MSKIARDKRTASTSGGFTLLEVLVAMAIATIGLLGLSMMQGTSIVGNSIAKEMTQATLLAQDLMERLQCAELDPDGVDDTPLSVGKEVVEEGLDENGVVADGGIFTRSYAVAANTDFSRRVTVTVSWTDSNAGDDNQRQVQFTTITRGDQN